MQDAVFSLSYCIQNYFFRQVVATTSTKIKLKPAQPQSRCSNEHNEWHDKLIVAARDCPKVPIRRRTLSAEMGLLVSGLTALRDMPPPSSALKMEAVVRTELFGYSEEPQASRN
jgi:hypothetical protein